MNSDTDNSPAPLEPGCGDKHGNVTRIERFQSLIPGQYWRAIADIPEDGVTAGTVYLIENIRDVDDDAHTIILRAHPGEQRNTGSRRYLADDFVTRFEHEPDGERIRQQEIARIQEETQQIQQEIVEAQKNPELIESYVQRRLAEQSQSDSADQAPEADSKTDDGAPESGALGMPIKADEALGSAFSGGITQESITAVRTQAEHQGRIASIQAEWVKERTDEISNKLRQMEPYYRETAAAAMAATQDVREGVDRINRGLETLDLYVGDDVVVETLTEGESAPSDEPLSVAQRKLFIEEELSVWQDVDEDFDVSNFGEFLRALTEHDNRQKLIDQIFPAQRCVVAMATNRRPRHYGDPIAQKIMNERNRECFLLVRDGQNLHLVSSPVESHKEMKRLFPTRDDQDRIFQGWDGSEVTFNDLAYTDRLKSHEAHALHYKRLLVLLAGLDHRLKLMGDFYPGEPNLDFMTMEFQNRHFRFIHDDDAAGGAIEADHEPLGQWVGRMNSYLQPGSRIIACWNDFLDADNAPGAVTFCRIRDRFILQYAPVDPYAIAVVRREHENLITKIHVRGETETTERLRDFHTRVEINPRHCGTFDYLVLDAVDPEELAFYIHNRKARRNHLDYIRMFKRALQALQQEREGEKPIRKALESKFRGRDDWSEDELERVINQAIRLWRCRRRGAQLPESTQTKEGLKALSEIETIVWVALRTGGEQAREQAETIAREIGVTPLRLSVTGAGKAVLYTTPRPEERNDRLEPDCWVKVIQLEHKAKGWRPHGQKVASLTSTDASEMTQQHWEEAEQWVDLDSAFETREQKDACFTRAEEGARHLNPFLEDFEGLYRRFLDERRKLNLKGSMVENPKVLVPIGTVIARERDQRKGLQLCLSYRLPEVQFCYFAPDDKSRDSIAHELSAIYRKARLNYREFLSRCENWRANSEPLIELSMVAPKDLESGGCTMADVRGTVPNQAGAGDDLDMLLRNLQLAVQNQSVPALELSAQLLDRDGIPRASQHLNPGYENPNRRLVQAFCKADMCPGARARLRDHDYGGANQVIEIQPWNAEPVTAEDEEFRHKHCGVWASFEGQASTLLARTLNVPTHTIGSRVSVHDLVLCDENRNPITNEVLAGLERATLYVWRKDELGIEEDASE